MPLKDGHLTKMKSNCLSAVLWSLFDSLRESYRNHFFLCVFLFITFNKDTKKKQAEVFTFIIILNNNNNFFRVGHKGRRTPEEK